MDRKERDFLEQSLLKVYERAMAHRMNPMLFNDRDAEGILRTLDYAPQKEPSRLACYLEGLRSELAKESAKAFLRRHPFALIVLYECGLDLPFSQFDNGRCRCLCLDSEARLKVRDALIPERVRETRVALDAEEADWVKLVLNQGIQPVFVIFSDRLLTHRETEVKQLTDRLARIFPEGGMFFEYRKPNVFLPEVSRLPVPETEEVLYYVRDAKREIPYYSGKIRLAERITHLPQGYARLLPAKEAALLEMMLADEMFAFANLLFE